MNDKLIEVENIGVNGPVYCEKCGGCGYIGCDGIRSFLEKHVRGKTDCSEEESFIQEIISYVESE